MIQEVGKADKMLYFYYRTFKVVSCVTASDFMHYFIYAGLFLIINPHEHFCNLSFAFLLVLVQFQYVHFHICNYSDTSASLINDNMVFKLQTED